MSRIQKQKVGGVQRQVTAEMTSVNLAPPKASGPSRSDQLLSALTNASSSIIQTHTQEANARDVLEAKRLKKLSQSQYDNLYTSDASMQEMTLQEQRDAGKLQQMPKLDSIKNKRIKAILKQELDTDFQVTSGKHKASFELGKTRGLWSEEAQLELEQFAGNDLPEDQRKDFVERKLKLGKSLGLNEDDMLGILSDLSAQEAAAGSSNITDYLANSGKGGAETQERLRRQHQKNRFEVESKASQSWEDNLVSMVSEGRLNKNNRKAMAEAYPEARSEQQWASLLQRSQLNKLKMEQDELSLHSLATNGSVKYLLHGLKNADQTDALDRRYAQLQEAGDVVGIEELIGNNPNIPIKTLQDQLTGGLNAIGNDINAEMPKEFEQSWARTQQLEQQVGGANLKTWLKDGYRDYQLLKALSKRSGIGEARKEWIRFKQENPLGVDDVKIPDFRSFLENLTDLADDFGSHPSTRGEARAFAQSMGRYYAARGLKKDEINTAVREELEHTFVDVGGERVSNGQQLSSSISKLGRLHGKDNDEVLNWWRGRMALKFSKQVPGIDAEDISIKTHPANANIVIFGVRGKIETFNQDAYSLDQMETLYSRAMPLKESPLEVSRRQEELKHIQWSQRKLEDINGVDSDVSIEAYRKDIIVQRNKKALQTIPMSL